METGPKAVDFSDHEKSLGEDEVLRPALDYNQFEEVGARYEEPNSEANIQIKYYNEFKKIYLTSFKLWSEIRKQAKAK